VRRGETVSSVGPILLLTAIAVFTDVSRFGSTKRAAGYVGLAPSTFQSGDRDTTAATRSAAPGNCELCYARRRIRRSGQGSRYTRTSPGCGYKLAGVAVDHHLCGILFAMLRDGSDFDMQRIGVKVRHFTRTTTCV